MAAVFVRCIFPAPWQSRCPRADVEEYTRALIRPPQRKRSAYDAKEETWELLNDNYPSIIPAGLKWRDWAVDRKDGEALTGDGLLDFVNNTLFPTLITQIPCVDGKLLFWTAITVRS